MKIIAKMNSNTVLCEISENEIARLYGATSRYDKGFNVAWMEVGFEHDLAEAIVAIERLRSFDNKQFRYLKQRIDEMQDSYNKIVDGYERLMLFDNIKELPGVKE